MDVERKIKTKTNKERFSRTLGIPYLLSINKQNKPFEKIAHSISYKNIIRDYYIYIYKRQRTTK